jgi:AcrR family transcriptional regulator
MDRGAAVSTTPTIDLRARRTRKWLQDALLSLMREKPFRDIQVTEIVDRAEVSRAAFYLHFRSKEELLFSHVDGVFEAFHLELAGEVAAGRVDLRRFTTLLFEYWERYAPTLRLVIEADMQQVLLERLRGYVETTMATLDAGTGAAPDPRTHSYVVDFVAGGSYLLLTRWIASGMPTPAEEMGLLLYELSAPCARVATRAAG